MTTVPPTLPSASFRLIVTLGSPPTRSAEFHVPVIELFWAKQRTPSNSAAARRMLTLLWRIMSQPSNLNARPFVHRRADKRLRMLYAAFETAKPAHLLVVRVEIPVLLALLREARILHHGHGLVYVTE